MDGLIVGLQGRQLLLQVRNGLFLSALGGDFRRDEPVVKPVEVTLEVVGCDAPLLVRIQFRVVLKSSLGRVLGVGQSALASPWSLA